jgi:site-specific DNA-methyltransferase (adenine-specific)
MGKKWDYDVPSMEFWQQVFRVLKPGGHVLSFGGTRTYHRMVVNIEDAGFEIRDQVMWLYGSGFPKSHNIGKAVDKLQGNEREEYVDEDFIRRNPDTGQSKKGIINKGLKDGAEAGVRTKGTSPYEGWGTALKPANEPICVARKPLSEKTVAENVLKWGTGGINIDGCRVGSNVITNTNHKGNKYNNFIGKELDKTPFYTEHEGRFPANLILECICDKVIKGEKGEIVNFNYSNNNGSSFKNKSKIVNCIHYNDKGDIHTNPNCPCKLLDEQSGVSESVKSNRGGNRTSLYEMGSENKIKDYECGFTDKGGASRFFYQAKVSKAERNMGLDGFEDKKGGSMMANTSDVMKLGGASLKGEYKEIENVKNNHPTVKPINLMTYLCRLVTPPNGIVLDPFMGSGSTGIAARLEGFDFIGMEMDENYFNIAEARINNYENYRKFMNKK